MIFIKFFRIPWYFQIFQVYSHFFRFSRTSGNPAILAFLTFMKLRIEPSTWSYARRTLVCNITFTRNVCFCIFSDLYCRVLEKANVTCEHYHLLMQKQTQTLTPEQGSSHHLNAWRLLSLHHVLIGTFSKQVWKREREIFLCVAH